MWYFIIGCFFISACTGESLHADVLDHYNYRVKRENKSAAQQETELIQAIKYRPFNEVPERIKKLVVLQQTPETVVYWPIHPDPVPAPHQTQEAAESAPGVHRTAAPEPIIQSTPSPPATSSVAPPLAQTVTRSQFQPTTPQSAQQSTPLYQPLSIPLAQHQPKIEAAWSLPQIPAYNPKIEYVEPPKQQNYKGIQAIQAGTQQGPLPLHGQSLGNQETYVPQYKTSYSPQQQQLTLHAAIKAQWNQENKDYQPNVVYRPAENGAPSGWAQALPQGY